MADQLLDVTITKKLTRQFDGTVIKRILPFKE